MNIRLIATDMDGTLLNNDHTINPAAKKKLIQAQERGIHIVLISGRDSHSLMPYAKELEMDRHPGNYLSCLNGLVLYDLDTQQEQRRLAGVLYTMERKGFSLSSPYTFAEDISTRTATIISERSIASPGVSVEQGSARSYPGGSMAAHILGHVGPLTEANIQEFEENGIEYELDDIIGLSRG